jgi:hypothetical protein
MRSKRFTILAAGLVALNLGLWLAPPGLAVREAVINQLFGQRLIRAEVVARGAGNTTVDYLLDRGVLTAVAPDSLTLREQDGKVQVVPVDGSTQVSGPRRFTSLASLRRNLRVLVVRPANGAASLVEVEGLGGVKVPLPGAVP